jgi:hypothetical protein
MIDTLSEKHKWKKGNFNSSRHDSLAAAAAAAAAVVVVKQ